MPTPTQPITRPLLRQVLAQSTKMVLEMQAQRDVDLGMSVVDRLRSKFFRDTKR